jgi:hypothetical protein
MKFSFTGGRAYTDFAQGLGVAELPKEHGHKLAAVVEAQGESLGTVLRSAVSNSRRESRICEKVLATRIKPQPPELDQGRGFWSFRNRKLLPVSQDVYA